MSTKTSKLPISEAPDYAIEAFEELKKKLEPKGHKFILFVFERDQFLQSSKDGKYEIHVLASCGQPVVDAVLKDFTRNH